MAPVGDLVHVALPKFCQEHRGCFVHRRKALGHHCLGAGGCEICCAGFWWLCLAPLQSDCRKSAEIQSAFFSVVLLLKPSLSHDCLEAVLGDYH